MTNINTEIYKIKSENLTALCPIPLFSDKNFININNLVCILL